MKRIFVRLILSLSISSLSLAVASEQSSKKLKPKEIFELEVVTEKCQGPQACFEAGKKKMYN